MPLLERLVGIIAPHNCLICRQEGKLVCAWCALDAFPALPSRCFRCKRITKDFSVCDRCRPRTRLKQVWVSTGYGDVAKDLMHQYKFGRARAAAEVIAQAMNETLPHLPADTLVIPVPTATSRVRQRGYDQAVLLAKSIATHRGLSYERAVTHLSQSRQVGAGRQQRLDQLKDNFRVVKPAQLKGRPVLVVDDVVTTGATLDAMAAALRQAGAKQVMAVAFAQKQ